MAHDNFKPEIWSARILYNLRKNFVFSGLVNRNYEGEITKAGDTVHITTPTGITVNDYSGTVVYQTPGENQQSLLIDQKKYWAFDVDDVDAVQANVELIDINAEEAGVSMADTVDQSIAGLYTAAGSTVALNISANDNGVRAALLEAAEALDDNNVPQAGRWLTVTPRVLRSIKGSPDYSVASELGDTIKMTGALGMIEGFNVFMSRNVAVATQHKCMFGTNAAITFAEQLVKTEALRREGSFADALRGLLVYGHKVVRPEALGLLDVTVA